MLRVLDTKFSLLILSLADTPVVMRSMSMVPAQGIQALRILQQGNSIRNELAIEHDKKEVTVKFMES